MALQPTKHIWHNGKLIPWDQAQIHVMSHVIHYGSSVFEGIRCYKTDKGAAIFRLQDHMQRMLDSAKIYRMDLSYTLDQMNDAVIETVESNGVAPCYIRPIAFRGYGELGVNPLKNPIEVYVGNFAWGKYVSGDHGADICISSWNRMAPNTLPALAKAGANYMNSQLIHMEAKTNGYDEGVGLDVNGLVSEGSGENLFVVHRGQLLTSYLGSSVLAGITRASILTLARDMGIPVVEQPIPRELLYIADEVFFTGTAAEVTPVRSIDRVQIKDGVAGPVTKQLATEYFGIATGKRPDRFNWLTPVNMTVDEPVSV
ncbi:MAG: branched-chain amino acid transaminase [Acidobacteriaceae bacterium]|jgi:branched-chain amino acid aminotransferase